MHSSSNLILLLLMDELYKLHSSINVVGFHEDIITRQQDGPLYDNNSNSINIVVHELEEAEKAMGMSDLIKAQIANHPLYQYLVSAYIDCRKVGAPPEMASILDETSIENCIITSCPTEIGTNPEIDEFMESYCGILHKCKEELSKPFDEATAFLNNIKSQLSDLCNENLTPATFFHSGNYHSDDDLPYGEMEKTDRYGHAVTDKHELKETLMRKYSGYLSSLRNEVLKKKRGTLSKDARSVLLNWWNTNSSWPYPTEEEKARLSNITGLDTKQINNWFINQRKRHWRPSEDMRFALMEGFSGNPGRSYVRSRVVN